MNRLLVDSHVHFYSCFDRDAFFEGAWANFRGAASRLDPPAAEAMGCLLLTETASDHYFRSWHEAAARPGGNGWTFRRTAEDHSLLARRNDGKTLVIVAGRQVATIDGLEVLALCQDGEFATGLAMVEALEAVRQSGAVPVLPWGFGKWSFRRGALVAELLDSSSHPDLFLGDNGGRLGLAPAPKLFRRAEQKGVLVLPGSDPLPFSEQATRAGSYGFVLSADIDLQRPAAQLAATLRGTSQQPAVFGRLETLGRFFKNQLAMQLRKRGLKKA